MWFGFIEHRSGSGRIRRIGGLAIPKSDLIAAFGASDPSAAPIGRFRDVSSHPGTAASRHPLRGTAVGMSRLRSDATHCLFRLFSDKATVTVVAALPAFPVVEDGAMNKVAKVTFYFWVMKICATTLGETAGDLLSMTMNVGYAVSSLILITAFVGTLLFQLRTDKFHPTLYWAVIVSTSTAGTTMSDYLDRTLGLGYVTGSAILFAALLGVLAVWRTTEGTLSVSHISTRRAELFYWFAILISNTLGTAMGDFLADSSGLGFLGGAALIAGALALVVAAFGFTRLDRVMLFWIAFVLTRPFGATFGDLLTKPVEKGGLDLGTLGASVVLAALLVAVIVYTSRKDRRLSQRHTTDEGSAF
ncbi:MAG: COG4705 family protein [Lysobacter sp.]